MKLRELYLEDKELFTTKVEELKNRLFEDGWKSEEVEPLIKFLSDGFVSKDLSFVSSPLHVSTYNIILFRIRDRSNLEIETVRRILLMILEAMDIKIEGSVLDTLNPSVDED